MVFCYTCGKRIETEGASFCPRCGTRLAAAPAAQPVQYAQRVPARTPKPKSKSNGCGCMMSIVLAALIAMWCAGGLRHKSRVRPIRAPQPVEYTTPSERP